MQAVVPSGGPSAGQFTGPASALHLKFSADIAQSALMPSGRTKKRGRDENNLDSNKRERLDKSIRDPLERENVWKLDLSILVGKDGGLFNSACIEQLICLMQHERTDGAKKRIDVLLGRTMFINIILATQQVDCLNKFVKFGGLPLLDEWLQDAFKGKPGDNESPSGGERVSEGLVLILLRTLERLPVDLVALQTCCVGKSVNSLRNHRHLEIQKRARKLVDMWKKRVDAEISQSGVLNVVLSHGMPLPTKQHRTEHNLSLQLKEVEVFDVAVKGAFGVNSVSQRLNSTEVVAQGESSCTGAEKFGSVASLCSPAVCDNQSKSPSTSLSEKSLSNSSQTAELESLWFDATLKSTNAGLSDCDGKGKSSLTVHHEENVQGSGSCVRDGKVSAGECQPASVEKASILWHRNVALEVSGHNVYGSDMGTSMRDQNVPQYWQRSLHAICGSSMNEIHTPSSGSSSPSMSGNHAHLDSGDLTDDRNTGGGLAASSPKGNIEKSCSTFPASMPMDRVRSEYYVIDDWKGRKSLPAVGCAVGNNKNVHVGELKQIEVPTTSSAFSSVNFSGKGTPTSEIATAGISLLASVAASECSIMEKKVHTSSLEKRSSTLGTAIMNKENSLSPKLRPMQQGKILDSQKPTIQREASRFSTERELFDRTSSTVSSPSDAETKFDTSVSEGVWCSDGHLPVEAPNAINATFNGRSPALDSVQPTSNLLKSTTDDPRKIKSVERYSIDHADSDELCKLQAAPGKADKQFTATSVLTAEAMGESSISGMVEADPLKENEDRKERRRISTTGSHMESNSISKFIGDDAREVARQVSGEVEHERLKSAKNSSDRSQNCGSFIMELPSKTFMSAEYYEIVENCSRKPPSGTRVATSFQPKTIDWNLNYTLDEKAECAKHRRLDQAESASGQAVLEGGDVTPTDTREHPDASSDNPASLQAVFSSILVNNETALWITAPPLKDLKQVSSTTGTSDLNTFVSGPENAGVKRNDRLQRLEFDLNEGLSCEEGFLQDSATSLSFSYAKRTAVLSGTGPTAPIAILAATKGPFIPPANPFRLTGELGWKGSAATSAFRPAQPRRNAEKQNGTVQTIVAGNHSDVKTVKPLQNFDLNVAADKDCEDAGTVCPADMLLKPCLQDTCFTSSEPLIRNSVIGEAGSCVSESSRNEHVVRPVWDLNCVNEEDDGVAILASQFRSVECLQSFKDSKSTVLDFDLNDGLVLQDQEELVPSAGSGHNCEIPARSTSETRVMTGAVNEGSVAHGRKAFLSVKSESPFSLGSTQSLLCTGTKDGPFHCDIYRQGHAFPSSGITYPTPPPTEYSFTGFPFGFTPASFCTLSAPFVDPSEVRPFSAFPPPMLSSEAVISSQIRPPYFMGVSDAIQPSSDNIWGRPNLDLNAGPEVGDADAKDDRSCIRQLSATVGFGEHRRVLHQSIDVVDHLKKKEADGCWGIQRAVLKQPMWQ